MSGTAASEVSVPRIAAVDALRGIAIAAMIVYHFAWDLSFFGLFSVDVINDPGWKAFARLTAGTFVTLVGVSLVLATRGEFRPKPYLRRLGFIVAAAIIVTAGTRYQFPDSFVFFGILHLIAFASVAALPFLWLPTPAVLFSGLAIFALPFFFRSEIFNEPLLWWVGLSTTQPVSVDYVPVFPWFGMTLIGIVAGRILVRYGRESALVRWTGSGYAGRAAKFAGRWSLLIYLVHQPILIGVLSVAAPFAGAFADRADQFVAQCTTQCRTGGMDRSVCEATCQCVAARMDEIGLSTSADINRLSAVERDRWISLINQCLPAALDSPPEAPAPD